jgi:inner membrane protein
MENQDFEESVKSLSRGEKISGNFRRNKLLYKLLSIVVLIVLLLAPLGMIQEQISERSQYRWQVKEEISRSAAGAQTLTGPIVAIHYLLRMPAVEEHDVNTGNIVRRHPPKMGQRTTFVAAKTLEIRGHSEVEQRYRGIYKARLFHADLKVEGAFHIPAELLTPPPSEGTLVETRVAILLGLSDLRGMDIDPEVLVNQRPMRFLTAKDKTFDDFLPGSRLELDLANLPLDQAVDFSFSFPLKLTGTENFAIAPTAESNIVHLQSTWAHPSFQGRFLPRKRQIGEAGFSAQWEVSQLARSFKDSIAPHSKEILGVAFVEPIDIYRQSERAVKYGSLFVVLTFAAFFLGEILRQRPMHIMQYLLVGLALTIFFLLLIALSEHTPFALAYLASAVACIGLTTAYLAGVFKAWRPAFSFGGGLAGLYGMLYVILQLEDQALLMGSLLLFAMLASVMLSTRRLDWFGLGQEGINGARRFRERQAWESTQPATRTGEE